MSDSRSTAAPSEPAKAAWGELFRDGRALHSALVILSAALHALQILVIAIIMPTVVADVGGADYYTWAAMTYTIGSIVGSASVGPVWTALGRRRGSAASGLVLLAGTVGCALAPDMATLVAARAVQGFAGGLVIGGSMAVVSTLFDARLRTRILAMNQGVWMVAQLLGPVVGGVFAEIGWWRGSFWSMVPLVLGFLAIAWLRLPRDAGGEPAGRAAGGFPVRRLTMLAAGVACVAVAGPVEGTAPRVALIAAGIGLVWLTFRLDGAADNRLYPSRALSVRAPVGLALWILFLTGMTQTAVTLFLPLLLQVVHGVTPLFISFVTIAISGGWTVGTFTVSGWSGARERFALRVGPPLMIAGLAGITVTAQLPLLVVLTAAAFVLGVGIGTHNVHLIARTMAGAGRGEERITAAAMPSIRSLGTAFGAAVAGMLAIVAGLGDATEPAAVGDAVTFVYACHLLPLAVLAVFMFRLVGRDPRAAAGQAAE